MSIEDNEDFQNSNEYLISDNFHVDDDVKVRDHYHIIRKYRCFVQRDSNVNFKLNHKISVVFHNLKNYDSHFFMQQVDKFNLKIK